MGGPSPLRLAPARGSGRPTPKDMPFEKVEMIVRKMMQSKGKPMPKKTVFWSRPLRMSHLGFLVAPETTDFIVAFAPSSLKRSEKPPPKLSASVQLSCCHKMLA